MEFQSSSLYREVEAITGNSSKPVHYLWTAEIHVNNITYLPLNLLSIDFLTDYETRYADEIIVELMIPGGTYAKRMYPFKDQIDITLHKHPLAEIADVANVDSPIETERYSATLIDTGNPLLESNGMNSPDEEAMNLGNIFNIKFQLVNKSLEQLRMISVGGIYRNVEVGDVVKGILTKESMKVEVDGNRLLKGVDMVQPANTKKRDHVVIPQGTKLVDIPEYVHYKCGGIYNSGIGYYLQGDHWYIYPCYDTTKFNESVSTMTVINVPTNKLPGIERTYRKDGSTTVILATGEIKFRDDSEVQQLNLGNGTRFADATKFMNGFTDTVNNKTMAKRGSNNSELLSDVRKNGNNNVQLSSNSINANVYVEYSKLARRQGSFLSFVWENSNPTIIFPGMPVKILYLEGEDINEVDGVLLKAHHYVQTKGEGMMSGRHISRSVISVFVKKVKV